MHPPIDTAAVRQRAESRRSLELSHRPGCEALGAHVWCLVLRLCDEVDRLQEALDAERRFAAEMERQYGLHAKRGDEWEDWVIATFGPGVVLGGTSAVILPRTIAEVERLRERVTELEKQL